MIRHLGFILLLLTLSLSAFAQQKDDDRVKPVKPKPDSITLRARRAALYSAILPGMGQVYNRRYWKTPIIWAGIGTCTYFAITNYGDYQKNNDLVNHTPSTDPNYSKYVYDRDYYRHNFELSVLIGAGVYALNIIDAYVDAHLREFDISPDLALSVSPLLYANFNAELVTGISLKFKFRHENRINRLRQNGQSY